MKKITVFTDGACWNNGKANAKAGYGVFVPKQESHFEVKISEKLIEQPTNQRAELVAILEAIKLLKETKCSILIYTDSMYSINCLTKWCKNWIKNDWKNSNKEEVKNQDLIKETLELTEGCFVEFIHINSHTKPPPKETQEHFVWKGNFVADKLATKSIELNIVKLDLN